MPRFTITPVEQRQLHRAWPLIRCVWRGATIDDWLSFGSALVGRGGGVIAATADDEVFHGLATYEAADSPGAGKVLRVDLLVAFELTRRAPARQSLRVALDRLATRFGCNAVAIAVPSRGCIDRLRASRHKLSSRSKVNDEVIFPAELREIR